MAGNISRRGTGVFEFDFGKPKYPVKKPLCDPCSRSKKPCCGNNNCPQGTRRTGCIPCKKN